MSWQMRMWFPLLRSEYVSYNSMNDPENEVIDLAVIANLDLDPWCTHYCSSSSRRRSRRCRRGRPRCSGRCRSRCGYPVQRSLRGRNAHTLLRQQIHQQRTGAAVAHRMEDGLVVLVLDHTVDVDVKQIRRVQWTTLRLRMELDTEDRPGFVDHSCLILECS